MQVKKTRKGVPTAAQDKRALAKQVKASTKLAKKLVTFEGPSGVVVRVGNDAKGIAQIAFFPARKTVEVGDTVTFAMSKTSIEVFQPFVLHRSDAPGTAVRYDGTNHGKATTMTGEIVVH